MTILEEKIIKNEIPIIVCKNEDKIKKPLVIMSHGFTGSKNDFERNGNLKHLAELGYYAVALDNRLHGDRPGPDFRSAILKSDGKIDLFLLRKAMKETADDVKLLIDELTLLEEVDETRIAIIGVSMGGFVTYRTIVIDDRIMVGIPLISSPYWDDIPGDVPILLEEEGKTELRSLSEYYQPSNHMDKYHPTALLMQVGDIDKHYDMNRINVFHHELNKYYIDSPGKLKLIIHPNTEHEFTHDMWQESLQWLKEHL